MLEANMNNCEVIRMVSNETLFGNVKANGFPQFRHWNSDVEYIFVKKGGLLLELDGNVIRLESNWFLVIASNVIHTFLEADEDSTLYIGRIPIQDFYLLKYLHSKSVIKLYSKCLLIKSPTAHFVNTFENLIFAEYGKYNQMYMFANAIDLTVQLLTKSVAIDEEIAAKAAESSEITTKIQSFIEAHISEPISLATLADHLGFSETYCSKIIKQKTKLGFSEYVNQVRLRDAEEFLQKTQMSITEICHAVGFNSVATFNRNFKKLRGLSPTEFRKSGVGK